jgi:hypothetical protein
LPAASANADWLIHHNGYVRIFTTLMKIMVFFLKIKRAVKKFASKSSCSGTKRVWSIADLISKPTQNN